jgi:hypothetical protein
MDVKRALARESPYLPGILVRKGDFWAPHFKDYSIRH